MYWAYILLPAALLAAVLVVFWRIGRAADPAPPSALFAAQRPQLQAAFQQAAAASGKPRGLRWLECQWSDLVEFARDKQTRQLVALAGVTIRFEAVAGGDMEGLPAVANLRNASAVFYFDKRGWHTQGKTVFNLNPDEALAHFAAQYERIPLAG